MHAVFAVAVISIRSVSKEKNVNIVKAKPIVIVVALVAALMGTKANAQQPTPLPHVHIAIPVTPPPGWVPKQWADFRARCQEIADKTAAHRPFTRDDWGIASICGSSAVQPPPPDVPPMTSGTSAPMMTPVASPSPAVSDPQSVL